MTELITSFDRRECSDCPLNTRCIAGKLAVSVAISMEREFDGTVDSFKPVLFEAAVDNNPTAFRRLARRMSRDLSRANDDYNEAGTAFNQLMASSINALGEPEIRELSVDNRTSRLEQALEEFANSPVAPSEIPTLERLLAAAEDAVGFNEEGQCIQPGFSDAA
jgi:hypothetical protein